MNQSNKEFSPVGNRSKRVKWIATISLIPIVLFVLFLCFIGYREVVAYRELTDKLDTMRQADEPIDDTSMAKHFEKTTHKEGTAAWSEAFRLSRSANAISNGLPLVGDREMPSDLRPGAEWPDEPRVADYLKEIQPLLKTIHAADAFPKPVWMPIEFNGLSTTLEVYQETRMLARNLELDASHALFHKNGERALQDIRSLQSVAKAFDIDCCLVTRLITIAIQGMHKGIINRSLAMDCWTEDQLADLSAQVRQPYDVALAWRTSMVGERAMVFQAINDSRGISDAAGDNNPVYRLPILPSGKLSLLRAYDAALAITSANTNELVGRAAVAEKEVMGIASSHYLVGLFFPAISACAEAFDRDEVFRRLTVTSLAVKRFQLKNKRFPKSLPELIEVGLTDRDWTTTEGKALGYEVENDMAYVWMYRAGDKKKSIPPSRPIITPEEPSHSTWNVVSIR